ncbi:MAG: TadE/TadG family type IV pilus assembly protein [Planctomycetota bacterium]
MTRAVPDRSQRRQKRARRGVAATEFAVCLPVLVLLLLGMIEACSMVFLKQSLACAAYEGAHTALAPGATSSDVRRVCEQILADRRVAGATITINPTNIEGMPEGEYLEVQVSAPTDRNGFIPGRFFQGQTLSSTAVMMKEI